ncbi:MAG: site-2 protease family protein [Acidobacteria bacterium]|nr:site-2 protease family protein [Acidobacteriota bacterium]
MGISQEHLAALPLWYVAFLLSLTFHEASHALVAMWGGDQTAYHSGQVTLNPLPHMRRELFGTVLVPLISFFIGGYMIGWGSAPYDPLWEQRHPRRAAVMACAGPAANFLLAFVAILAKRVFGRTGMGRSGMVALDGFAGAGSVEALFFFLNILFMLNLLLACFNLIPVAPLDGHTAIGVLLPEKLFLRWLEFARSPMLSLLGLLIAWRMVDYIYYPVLSFVTRLL